MPPTCFQHPDQPAGWQCESCARELCADCTAWVFGAREHIRFPACLHCRGHAPPLRLRRALITPFASIAPSALPWAMTGASLVTAFACALLITLGTFLGAGWLFRFAVIGYFFDITRSTANGHDEVPLPADFQGVFTDMLDPALRLLLSVIWCWGAFSLASMSAHWDKPGVYAALWLVSACYVPVALLVAAARAPLLQVANPITILSYLVRLGWDSLRLAAFCGVTLALYAIVGQIEERLGGRAIFGLFGLNLLVFIPCTMLVSLLGMATFRAAGLLLRVRGDDIGYGPAEAYLDPILGATEPRGVLAPTGLPAERQTEVGFELAPGSRDGGPAQLAQLVIDGQLDDAMQLVRAAQPEIPAIWLSAPGWIALGRHCTAAGDHRSALFALRRATEIAPEGPFAPQAFLLVAHLFAEAITDQDRCTRTLAHLAQRFPQSAEGRAAAAWLQERAQQTT